MSATWTKRFKTFVDKYMPLLIPKAWKDPLKPPLRDGENAYSLFRFLQKKELAAQMKRVLAFAYVCVYNVAIAGMIICVKTQITVLVVVVANIKLVESSHSITAPRFLCCTSLLYVFASFCIIDFVFVVAHTQFLQTHRIQSPQH
jgi:hypothetical protein